MSSRPGTPQLIHEPNLPGDAVPNHDSPFLGEHVQGESELIHHDEPVPVQGELAPTTTPTPAPVVEAPALDTSFSNFASPGFSSPFADTTTPLSGDDTRTPSPHISLDAPQPLFMSMSTRNSIVSNVDLNPTVSNASVGQSQPLVPQDPSKIESSGYQYKEFQDSTAARRRKPLV